MKAASLRLGGQGLRTTYDDHLVIIGDAAGHIDPLTGEGIHTAIMVSLPTVVRLCYKSKSNQGSQPMQLAFCSEVITNVHASA